MNEMVPAIGIAGSDQEAVALLLEVQEVLQSFEMASFELTWTSSGAGVIIRALSPNPVSESARLSRLTKRNQ